MRKLQLILANEGRVNAGVVTLRRLNISKAPAASSLNRVRRLARNEHLS